MSNELLHAINEPLYTNNVTVNASLMKQDASNVIVNAYNETYFACRGTAGPRSQAV